MAAIFFGLKCRWSVPLAIETKILNGTEAEMIDGHQISQKKFFPLFFVWVILVFFPPNSIQFPVPSDSINWDVTLVSSKQAIRFLEKKAR